MKSKTEIKQRMKELENLQEDQHRSVITKFEDLNLGAFNALTWVLED